jgi:hypothetical protein
MLPTETIPTLAGLSNLLQKAQKAVPAVKYAVGIIGIAAATAIVSFILGHNRASIILLVLMFVGMVLLFLFATLVSTGASSSVRAAANFVLWTVVLVFSATLVVGFLAVAIRWPAGFVEFIFPKTEASNSDLLEKIVLKDNLSEAADAIAELSLRCDKRCDDRHKIIKSLTTVLHNTRHLDRELNVPILEALKKLSNSNLRSILRDELENRELVDVDLSNTDLSGVSLRGAFAILSDFRNANLSSADLSDTALRGSDFRGARLKNASMSDADWFNSFGLSAEQLSEVTGPLSKCPEAYRDASFAPFIGSVDSRYGISYKNYPRDHQQKLKDQWKVYTSPKGLCDTVERRK